MSACYLVTAPVTYVERILDDGSGPTHHEAAVLVVRATSRRRAVVLAIRAWRRQRRRLRRDARPDFLNDAGLNPFGEVRAELYGVDELDLRPAGPVTDPAGPEWNP